MKDTSKEKEKPIPDMTEFGIDEAFSILLGNETEREVESDQEPEKED